MKNAITHNPNIDLESKEEAALDPIRVKREAPQDARKVENSRKNGFGKSVLPLGTNRPELVKSGRLAVRLVGAVPVDRGGFFARGRKEMALPEAPGGILLQGVLKRDPNFLNGLGCGNCLVECGEMKRRQMDLMDVKCVRRYFELNRGGSFGLPLEKSQGSWLGLARLGLASLEVPLGGEESRKKLEARLVARLIFVAHLNDELSIRSGGPRTQKPILFRLDYRSGSFLLPVRASACCITRVGVLRALNGTVDLPTSVKN
ncbi:hypothetical protein CRG98_029587 [Punica granatum]|uniref:Uncharacterized protein n=1 Tax=Punica granatum TaxID=22663 RepID=A0A2I0J1B3_PUNGR|nr:hypothetical protein CRG98_029587 [Punica granatum]